MLQTRKVGIVGVGHVGSYCALSMLLQGVCDEMVLMDIIRKGKSSCNRLYGYYKFSST